MNTDHDTKNTKKHMFKTEVIYVQHNTELCSHNNFSVEKQYVLLFWAWVCSLSYPARKMHAPYWHLWLVQLYHIFPLFHKWHHLWKKKLNIKCVFCLPIPLTFVWHISHSTKNSVRNYHKCSQVLMSSACYSYHILINFFLTDFWKIFKY